MLHSLSGRAESTMQARLLTELRDHGPLSRTDLGDRLGVSRTTIGVEVARLADMGLAREAGPAQSRGGRRSTMVDLADDVRFAGIAIGATGISVGITDGRLEVLETEQLPCDIRRGPEEVLGTALERVRRLLDKLGIERPMGVGCGVPGPVDFWRGVSVAPPLMPGWDGYPVRDTVARELGCPAVLDNDVNVMAMGEQHAGVARQARDLLFVKIGTGIGCGIVVDGQLYRGANGCAGDIGHIQVTPDGVQCACGNHGCLEALAGGAALARNATDAALDGRSAVLAELLDEHGTLGAEALGVAVSRGDPAASVLLRECGQRVGQVIAGLVSFFNPGMIVIGGRVSLLGHALLAEIRGTVYQRSLPLATGSLPIVLSELPHCGGVIGAARLVSAEVFAPSSASA
ncbi:ROK family transcriptional regulator [Nocardioides marinquilinus]|uniref:ROK family transcriptional regulator n=1 Tax=Nocardioides marinquilinus TaxID=1210400 RepID=A0ABP9PH36_9ACTN